MCLWGFWLRKLFKGSKNKGLIYALLINGTGLGFVILSPLWVYLNLTISWQEILSHPWGVFSGGFDARCCLSPCP